MITKRPVTEPLNRRRSLAERTPVPGAPIAVAAGVLALVLAGVTSAPAASPIAVGGDRVVSVAFVSPLPAAADDSGGSDDSGADYGPSAPPMSAPCGDPSCSDGSASSSSGSGGDESEDDLGSGGISGFIKKVWGGASDAAGSAAGAGSQGGEGSSGEDGAGLASKIVSSVVGGVKSMLSQLGSGGN